MKQAHLEGPISPYKKAISSPDKPVNPTTYFVICIAFTSLALLACLGVDEADAAAEVLAALDEEAVVEALTLLDDPPAPPAAPEVVAGLAVLERAEDELAALVVADDATRGAVPLEEAVETLEVTDEVATATEVAVVLALLDEEPC